LWVCPELYRGFEKPLDNAEVQAQPERRRNMLQDNSENKQQPSNASENELIAIDCSLGS